MKKTLILLAMCSALTACGGHDNGSSGGSMQSPPPATGGGMSSVDAFISKVMSIIGMTDETSEPAPVDSVTPTTPENTEPVTTS